jgi:hypothetical protein
MKRFCETHEKIIELKVYASEYEDKLPSVVQSKKVFDNPKPTELIAQLLSFTTKHNSIVLYSFAGSSPMDLDAWLIPNYHDAVRTAAPKFSGIRLISPADIFE